ncbi:BTB/POZ domain-containing protein kctd15-like isoform X3 [Penaeus japonicus]|uniref:BTB/POZ domain-containing protein kctd15-like isoform X3 n=1 Tax=Penaeus japonicus TaxID=27405 RepID=UPI001C713043|nr:BTB/POZ domain-containing protein kctd15-like isoform X3 [Penaeus japonicus]
MQVEKLVSKTSSSIWETYTKNLRNSTPSRMLSPSISPATSPTLTHSGSPTPPLYPTQPKISGIPTVAAASRYGSSAFCRFTAPVHIDVGGSIYTSSLETLTRYPESRLARLFNGSIPIVLDSLKQHYFIDRDGKMFRHILNYMRHGRTLLPDDFSDHDLLLEEARFFEINGLVKQVEDMKKARQENRRASSISSNSFCSNTSSSNSSIRHKPVVNGIKKEDDGHGYEVIALNISPDLGERVMLSGERCVIEELFPEVAQAMMDARSSLAWNHDHRFIIRFPLNGYCKLTSMQAIQRLLNQNFTIVASNGGGVEGQQFSEYLFCRKTIPL